MSDRTRREDIVVQIKHLRGVSIRRIWELVQEEIRSLPRQRWARRCPDFKGSPADFVKENYGKWVDGVWDSTGVTIKSLENDPALRAAYRRWVRKHPEDNLNLPEPLPPKSQKNSPEPT